MEPHRPGPDAELDYKDAIVLSPHKFIGGPGTPGVLVARRELFRNRVPTAPGGGTVAYVNPLEHVYLADPEHREEGGTPAIVESIRAGLAFQLKERVGSEAIREREEAFIGRAMTRLGRRSHRSGSSATRRCRGCRSCRSRSATTAGTSITTSSSRSLNDLFGIQSRGGCSCAGPYGHRLLGIDIETSHAFEREISRGCEGIKPGWIRVNFNYFISEAVFDFIVRAVALVARDGWRLTPWYRFDPATGLWRHAAGSPEPPLSLHDIHYDADGLHYPAHRHREPESRLADYLAEAERILADPAGVARPATRRRDRSSSARTSSRSAGSGFPRRSPSRRAGR